MADVAVRIMLHLLIRTALDSTSVCLSKPTDPWDCNPTIPSANGSSYYVDTYSCIRSLAGFFFFSKHCSLGTIHTSIPSSGNT